jgi:hypothetical protein
MLTLSRRAPFGLGASAPVAAAGAIAPRTAAELSPDSLWVQALRRLLDKRCRPSEQSNQRAA